MRFQSAMMTMALLMFAAEAPAAEQTPASAASPVQKASLERAASSDANQRITFHRRPARVGDAVEQTLALEMRVATALRQGNQIGEKNRTTARNEQRRVVTTTHVENDRAMAVRVQFLTATKRLSANDGSQPAATEPGHSEVPQPVAGKSYLCQRQPGTHGELKITDEAGHIPPTDEYEFVAQQMEAVGRANPLAEFLAGRSMHIGQSIDLPKETASKIFNLGDQFGEVSRFTLRLEKLEPRENATCATFVAHVEAASNNASQMRLEMDGVFLVDVNTCRSLQVDLTGPIAMSETRGSYSTSYQAIATGQLKMSIASTFRDAKR